MAREVPEPKKGQQGVGRSFQHAYQGIVSAARTQRNLRLHFFVALGVLIAGLILGVSALEMAVLVLTICFIFVVEMINTALEFVVDLVTKEYHPLAKLAKDVSAGSVLVSSVGAVLVGLLVLADDLGPLFARGLGSISRQPGELTLVSVGVVVLAVVLGKALTRSPPGAFYGGMPSGHAAAAFAGWVAASFTAAGGRYGSLVSLISLLMALLVCQSRVEGGGHNLYQVATGAAIGSLAAVAIFQIL